MASATVFRKDYIPPTHWVDSVYLEFDLHPQQTHVHSTLMIRPNEDRINNDLVLNGRDLDLIRIAIDGRELDRSEYTILPSGDIVLRGITENIKLEIENVINPQVMGQMINAKIEALLKLTPYAKVDTTLVGVAGDTKTIPSWNYIGDAEDVAEGVEVALTQMTASTTSFNIKKAMKAVGITEEARLSGLGDPIGQAETQLAKSIAGKVDSDLLVAALKSSNVVDKSTTNAISYEGIVDAVAKFEDEEDGIEKVMFIAPAQEATLLKDPMFLSADKFEAGVAVRGAIGKIAGCWIKKSKKIKEASGVFTNPIIKMQPDSPETEYTEDELPALTILLKKDTTTDSVFKPRTQMTEITAVKYYGVALTNEAKVVLAKFAKTQPEQAEPELEV